ncbi:MAG: hypothetical protein N4A49_09700 [Marinifilaceae bacterium]|jgi:hypothetical protein|nr:hypothetical protein [Marinifilaceae bacterium]
MESQQQKQEQSKQLGQEVGREQREIEERIKQTKLLLKQLEYEQKQLSNEHTNPQEFKQQKQQDGDLITVDFGSGGSDEWEQLQKKTEQQQNQKNKDANILKKLDVSLIRRKSSQSNMGNSDFIRDFSSSLAKNQSSLIQSQSQLRLSEKFNDGLSNLKKLVNNLAKIKYENIKNREVREYMLDKANLFLTLLKFDIFFDIGTNLESNILCRKNYVIDEFNEFENIVNKALLSLGNVGNEAESLHQFMDDITLVTKYCIILYTEFLGGIFDLIEINQNMTVKEIIRNNLKLFILRYGIQDHYLTEIFRRFNLVD